MMDNFNRHVLRVAVAQICQSMGWDALQKSTHDTLTDVMQRYLEEIGKVAYGYTQLCNRTKPNLDDLHLAFQDTGVAVHELENYVAQVDPVQFIHPFTTYPRCKPCRLQHPSVEGEIVSRADFYSEHLPPLPKVCEEPKDEIEENPSEENSKALDKQESEKMKTSPLKESNHVLETSHSVLGKRAHDGPMFLPQSKRVRPDIPANLNFEKKENLENTDGESLSPATPVSPYLPQEIPKVPDEPAKEEIKPKVEPKKPLSLAKEMVLPLKKLTPPDKKAKLETSPNTKKPKTKNDKSASPKVTKKLPISSPRAELPNQKPKTEKQSLHKLQLPMKSKSPVVEKAAAVSKSVSEKSLKKQQSPLASPIKGSPLKKTSPSLAAKKQSNSPVVGKPRVDKHAKKKKGKALNETDAVKSSRQDIPTNEGLSTPKLMIKLLPKANLTKSSPGESKGLVSQKKTPKTPETKKKIKKKVKASENENIAEPTVSKVKISSSLLQMEVKKEHGKKKKKKKDKEKDKEREKHKSLKTDKTEPPIPKIRFKLDPSGESKVVETKPVAPKIITSSGQESSKESSVLIETKKVSRSIITETLSNTVDYDPSKAYFCPVCKKQDDGSPMVGCDGCDEWCHWACVGLIAAPPVDEKWYCPQCLLSRGTTKKSKSKKKELKKLSL